MTRPKAIGTRAETLVVNYAREWFPAAERLALAGSKDGGDIRLCAATRPDAPWGRWALESGGVMLQVKAGKSAKRAGALQIAQWAAQVETQRLNGAFGYGVLVVQRFNPYVPGPAGWQAALPFGAARELSTADTVPDAPGALPPLLDRQLWSSTLRDVLQLLRHAGYGAPLTDDEQENPT